ncbi:MAG: hypothetical protein KIB45_05960 [Negativicoccus succinicivorans]|uniref:hypothetical protein n=1 Tax=Negativicoccus succinicivorans TaxID=620903 RepID=UPI002352EE58|nr:hypothetical protein [Negativicoccus succinicivorans]MBS5890608.1 hypothetical protein [Negativicoccus succinicivorans]
MKDYDQIGNRDEWPNTSCGLCCNDGINATIEAADTESVQLSGGKQGPPGPPGERGEKGDQGEVDYTKVEVYVKNRVEQVFFPVGERLDKIERKIDEKIELSDWQEA